ncbi:hypothetical protein PVL29_005325 [Vitis rotundifolia]|uniref:Neprosin PEP catalytic domain-containing protein n=1 Tax=Vitis rotundifolia TaxID=103349 RepID=A0AA39ACQ5_VITRO|nr:hypothetical protein PVL29_005325 [Vitis rotundifolia]
MRVTIVVGLVTIFLVFCGYVVEGRDLWEEDLILETELKAINKPAVKTIQTEYGDTYDCVDVYKQPTLDHPLLKDHVVQMRPSAALQKTLKASRMSYLSSVDHNPMKIGLEDGCPLGTVPIRRTTKGDLIRAKSSFTKHHFNEIAVDAGGGGYEYAGIATKTGSGKVYRGAGARLDVYNPRAENEQISAAIIMVLAGPPGKRGGIRTGWMVNPLLYGDSRTRFFTSWTQENNGITSGCYDLTCPGFIQTSGIIPLGVPFSNVSQIGGVQYDASMMISQDPVSGDWWLMIMDEFKPIGYWPKTLFESLGRDAEAALWAGLAYSGSSDAPPMGSGVYQGGSFDHTCYMAQVIVAKPGVPAFSPPDDDEVVVQQSRCYHAGDNSYVDENWLYRFLFGGPGGSLESCK